MFYTSLEQMGHELKQSIYKTTGLTAFGGNRPNKFLAKLASDWRKPDGLFVLRPTEVPSILKGTARGQTVGCGPQIGRNAAAVKHPFCQGHSSPQ